MTTKRDDYGLQGLAREMGADPHLMRALRRLVLHCELLKKHGVPERMSAAQLHLTADGYEWSVAVRRKVCV